MNADITTWWESIGSHDVVIRNNRFINCRFEPAVVSGVIECLANPGGQSAPPGVHRRITIENNIIQGTGGISIKIGSVDGMVIANNIIDQPKNEAIFVYNSRNIQITDNKLTNSELGLKIGDGCKLATIKVKNNTGF